MNLPPDFDPTNNLIAHKEVNGTFHSVIASAALVESLVRDGTQASIDTAEKVISAVLACQITDPGDPHFGNFLWEKESEVVEDLNAVEFVLFRFIPLLIEFPDRLTSETRNRMRISIRNGTKAIARIDVHLLYTNIVLKDICNSCLGGELLGDAEIAERGYLKMRRWFDRTRKSGIPTEYNSPPYTTLAIEVLGRLSSTTMHEETRVLTAVAAARIAISAGIRINPETRRWAGPFGRAYRDAVLAEGPSEIQQLQQLMQAGLAPEWITDVINHRELPQGVVETSDVDSHTVVSTYHSKSFSLGVASRELSTQSNRFIAAQSQAFDLRYSVPKLGKIATMTTRYLHDDMWLGNYRVTPSRGWDHVFPEEGSFRGVQRGPTAIGVAMSRKLGAEQAHNRAYLAVVWTDAASVESIYVNGNLVTDRPLEISVESDICVVTETLMIGTRVLGRTTLGANAPIRLVEHDGMISLEIHNYLGPTKTFWELANPGAFFHGLPFCAFYTEVAERDQRETVEQFMTEFSSGISAVDLQESPGSGNANQRKLEARYSRLGQTLGIEVDLVTGELMRRFTEQGDMDLPKMTSSIALHSGSSPIIIGEARLDFGAGDAWLLSLPEQELWVAGIQGDKPTDVTLTTERGEQHFQGMTSGLIELRGEDVRVTSSSPGNQ
jgi:hypothetical protein